MKKNTIIMIILALFFVAGAFLVYHSVCSPKVSIKNAPEPPVRAAVPGTDSAKRMLQEGNTDGAIRQLEAMLAKNADSPKAENAYLLLGVAYEKNGEVLKSRDAYRKVMEKFPASNNVVKAQERIDNVNIKILFSRIITGDSFLYEVKKGDTLSGIAKKFGTTTELIAKSNALKDKMVRIGQKLKITKARFSIVVDKSQNILTLKDGNDVVKTYRVSTGKNSSTPTGNFKIVNRITNPTWYTNGKVIPPGDPKNILGSRWLGISRKGYGIHGTTEPKSIGDSVTAGCVRMVNADVEELYVMVPEGAEVIIVD